MTDEEWITKMAELEDGCMVSVGGMIGDVEHLVAASCGGERCGMCFRDGVSVNATHKVGEELYEGPIRHNLTQYVCCRHFKSIFGAEYAARWAGCQTVEQTKLEQEKAGGEANAN